MAAGATTLPTPALSDSNRDQHVADAMNNESAALIDILLPDTDATLRSTKSDTFVGAIGQRLK